jgi:2-methylisocitrate lyase-like PEP mutase family enzyme
MADRHGKTAAFAELDRSAAFVVPHPWDAGSAADPESGYGDGPEEVADTIHRLPSFAEAGTDVLHVPALPSLDAVKAVCSAPVKPVRLLAAGPTPACSDAGPGAPGIRRTGPGSVPPGAALTAVPDAAAQLTGSATFGSATSALGYAESNALLGRP